MERASTSVAGKQKTAAAQSSKFSLARRLCKAALKRLSRTGPREELRASAESVAFGTRGAKRHGKRRGCRFSLPLERRRKTIRAERKRRGDVDLLSLSLSHSCRCCSKQQAATTTNYPTCPPMTTIEGSMSHRLGSDLSPPATSPSVVAAACRRLTSVRTDCIPSDAMFCGVSFASLRGLFSLSALVCAGEGAGGEEGPSKGGSSLAFSRRVFVSFSSCEERCEREKAE